MFYALLAIVVSCVGVIQIASGLHKDGWTWLVVGITLTCVLGVCAGQYNARMVAHLNNLSKEPEDLEHAFEITKIGDPCI